MRYWIATLWKAFERLSPSHNSRPSDYKKFSSLWLELRPTRRQPSASTFTEISSFLKFSNPNGFSSLFSVIIKQFKNISISCWIEGNSNLLRQEIGAFSWGKPIFLYVGALRERTHKSIHTKRRHYKYRKFPAQWTCKSSVLRHIPYLSLSFLYCEERKTVPRRFETGKILWDSHLYANLLHGHFSKIMIQIGNDHTEQRRYNLGAIFYWPFDRFLTVF